MLYDDMRKLMKQKWGRKMRLIRRKRVTLGILAGVGAADVDDIRADFRLLVRSTCLCGGPERNLHCLCHRQDLPVPDGFDPTKRSDLAPAMGTPGVGASDE